LGEIFGGEVNHIFGQVNTDYRTPGNLCGYFCGDLAVAAASIENSFGSF